MPIAFTVAALVGTHVENAISRARRSPSRARFTVWTTFWRGESVPAGDAMELPARAATGMLPFVVPGFWVITVVLSVVELLWLPWLPGWVINTLTFIPGVLFAHALVISLSSRQLEAWRVGRSWWLLSWPVELGYLAALAVLFWAIQG